MATGIVSVKQMLARITEDISELIGEVRIFAGTTIPTGWHLCDGAAISRSTYDELFRAIGTTYGAGDGSTTFNLPDLRNKFPMGVDGTNKTLNAQGGYGSKVLPNHSHVVYSAATASGGMSAAGTHNHYLRGQAGVTHSGSDYDRPRSINHTSEPTGYTSSTTSTAHTHSWPAHNTQSTGNHGYYNNYPPYIGLNFIIYIGG